MYILYVILAILAGPVVIEFAGYWWHRLGEHGGKLGRAVVAKHYKHHEKDYPVTRYNPSEKKYRKAGSWSWYVLGALIIAALFVSLPRPYNYVAIVSGILYAKFVMSLLHGKFHVRTQFEKSKWFRTRRHLHEIHHWGPYNYGISFYFVDRLFGTYRTDFPEAKERNFPKSWQ